MKNRFILFLIVWVLIWNVVGVTITLSAEKNLNDEELTENVQKIKEKMETDGYTLEYTLFSSLLDNYYSEEEIKSIYSLSTNDFSTILGWMRRYLENGRLNKYSDNSSAEAFMNNEQWFILDYFINGTYINKTNKVNFVQNLPDYYWFEKEEDIPDTIDFTIKTDCIISNEDLHWVVVGSSLDYFRNYVEDIPYHITTNGYSSCLTLSAEDLLNLTAFVDEGYNTYKPDTVTVYAVYGGTISNICYITIGSDAAIVKGAKNDAVSDGIISIDVDYTDVTLNYDWSYNTNNITVEDYLLTFQGYFEFNNHSSLETLTKDNTEEFENIGYTRCNISYEDWEGIIHVLSAPLMPVLSNIESNNLIEEHLYRPITCFVEGNDNTYLLPDTDVTYQFFTLATDSVYSIGIDSLNDDTLIISNGFSYHIPLSFKKTRTEYDIRAYAYTPSGNKYEGYIERVMIMDDDTPYSGNTMELIDTSLFNKHLVVKDTDNYVDILNLSNTKLLYNDHEYTVDAWKTSDRISIYWYCNDINSYDNATLVSSNASKFRYNINTPITSDTTKYYYFKFYNKANELIYTSDIFSFVLHAYNSLTNKELFYVTEDGTLYSVLSLNKTITIPNKVNNMSIKKITGNAFYYCENAESIILPETLERVCEDAFYNYTDSIKNIQFSEGLLSIEDGSLPYNLEKINLPSSLKEVKDFSYNKIKEVTISLKDSCLFKDDNGYEITIKAEKIIFEEGITTIGNGYIDFSLEADEVILPSTLKTLAPKKKWLVGEMVLPNNLEYIDFSGDLITDLYGSYYSDSSEIYMSEVIIPNSVKTIKCFLSMPNLEKITYPKDLVLPDGFFSGCGLTNYSFSIGTTKIANELFMNSSLKTVTIPEGVTEIGDYAFYGTQIETIVLPSTLKTIGSYAFSESQISTIIIPNSVESLGFGVFENCMNLSSVTLSKRLTIIPGYTFSNCSSLTNINLSNSISRIGAYAFSNSNLSGSLSLPDGLLLIGMHAFENTNLTNVSFPNHLERIEDYAFTNVLLKNLSIPSSVTHIGSYTFAAYSKWGEPNQKIPFTKIEGMENVRYIGQYAFANTEITEFILPKYLKQLHKGIIKGTNITTLDLNSEYCTYIGDETFAETALVSLIIPDSVTTIGDGICKNCYELESIVLPSLSYARIPSEICSGCEKLVSVTIPSGITSIGEYAFNNCILLNNLVIADTVKTIGQYAFNGCESLTTISVPSRMVAVYDFAFAGTPLKKASFSSSLRLIGESAFENCSLLESITFEEGVVSIGKNAFKGCTSLTSLELPNSVTHVGDDFIQDSSVEVLKLSSCLYSLPSFKNNPIIREIVCESTDILSISRSNFEGCIALEKCIIGSETEIGPRAFYGCENLTGFVASKNVKSIGADAFYGCSSLKTFICGGDESTLETISSQAFYGCSSLSYCEMGNNVISIGISAFEGCISLQTLDLSPMLKTIGSCAFRGSGIKSLLIGRYVRDINVGYVDSFYSYERKKSCFYDMPYLETVVFLDQIIDVLKLEDAFLYNPMLSCVILPSSVGGMWAANGIDPSYSMFYQKTGDFGEVIYSGINTNQIKQNGNSAPIGEDYVDSLLPGYVGTTYIRYGNYESNKDTSNSVFYSVFKPNDRHVVLAFSSDYDDMVNYYNGFGPALQTLHNNGNSSLFVPTQNDFIVGMNTLTDYSIKVMADSVDITDQVNINWYVNWLGDNVLTDSASLKGFAWTYADFLYHFTISLPNEYAFDYKDYISGDFSLTSTDDKKTVIINLIPREKTKVNIHLPDAVKSTATLTLLQTVNGKVRTLDATIVDGCATVDISKDSNLLIYCTADGYYRYSGGIDSEALTNISYDKYISMQALPKESSFKAKFNILDILPTELANSENNQQLTELDSFEHINVKIINKTTNVETNKISLEYPYIVIEDFDTFYTKGDSLEITIIPDEKAEFYGLTTTLIPGDNDYGTTEGILNGYSIIYFTPTLPEDSTTGKTIVQVYDLLGNRVSMDIVSNGEMLIRRFKDGTYRLTAFEQNSFIGEMEKLSTFTEIGWTEDEYYSKELYLKSPTGQYVTANVPSAPNSSNLLKTKPYVTKTDNEYYQPAQKGTSSRIENVGGIQVFIPGDPDVVCDEMWYWTSNIRFRSELDSFKVKNALVYLSIPSVYDMEGFYRNTKLGYEQIYVEEMKKSSDGEFKIYTFDASFLEKDSNIDLFVSLKTTSDIPIETLQNVGLVSLSLKCDVTLVEETKTVYIGLGSISAVNKYLLESTIGIIHAENISSKTSIPVEVQAPPFSQIELYADGVKVATGKTNYTGSAVLKYDAPFSWLWWQYDVYAVVTFGNNSFQTASRSVTCHVDTVQPKKVQAEIIIKDLETGKVVFPTDGDNKNIVSIEYETGKKENIAIRQTLIEGKKYSVTRTFTASFTSITECTIKNVAILYDYIDENNLTKEDILWVEYDRNTHTYKIETSDIFVYNPVNMLYDLKIPTELGIEWENVGVEDYILLPGQLDAMITKNTTNKDNISLSELIESSLNDSVKDISLFEYFPAAMQADLLKSESMVREYCNDASKLFENIFGLNIKDFTEEDISNLSLGMVKDTFTPNDTLANSLRDAGFYEYPILGQENGLLIYKKDGNYELYDFSDGTHLKYSSTMLIDMMTEKLEVKKQQESILKLTSTMPVSNASYEIDYSNIYPKIKLYDQVIYNKLSLLDDLREQAYATNTESNEFKLYESVKQCLDEYEKVLVELNGTLQSWMKFEAKYGKEFYNQYLEGSALMEGFDYVNGVLGEAVGSLLDVAGLEVDSSDKLIKQFYDEQSGKVVFDINEQMLKETDSSQQIGVLVTELKNETIGQSGNIADYIITKESDVLISTQYDISKEATTRIVEAQQKLTKYNGGFTYTVDYGLPNDEIANILNNSTAMKNGLITVKQSTAREVIFLGGEDGFIKDNGVKMVYSYKSTQETTGSVVDVIIDADKNTIALSQAKVENITATKNLAKNTVKVAGKALEIVTLVDTVTSMYRDMEGQYSSIENMLPSYSKVIRSMFEYVEVYEEYYDMCEQINNKTETRESYTLLPTVDSTTFMEIYGKLNLTFTDSYMNAYTFAKLYNGQAYYWAIPESTVQQQSYIDPVTGEKVKFTGYFPCNMGTLLHTSVMKQYYDEHPTLGKQYKETLERCMLYSSDSVIALCALASQYQTAALREIGNLTMSGFELLPAIGLLGTGAKGVLAGFDAVDGMDYLRCQDTVISKTGILQDYESSLTITRKKIQNSMDGYMTHTEILSRKYPVTYITYNTAKERWYDLCQNHWVYTYYFTDEDGHLTGGSMEVALPNFPSGHPLGLKYEVGYTGEVQLPNEKWTYYSYTVDNYGILMGWSLEQYGLNEGIDYISRKVSSNYTSVKWKTKCMDPQIDPAGYVYEAVLSNRVEGATAKLYFADSNGDEVLWDGTDYGEINPQITDVGGYYSWMTPSGLWKVRIEKENYLPASSENNPNAVNGWLPVPPPQLDINIGLVSTLTPNVSNILCYSDNIIIVFSQYMDIDSFTNKVNLTINGVNTNCSLTFIDKEQAGTGENKYYGKTLMIKRLDNLSLNGNISITIDGSVTNYAGTVLGENYNSGNLTIERKITNINLGQDSFNVIKGSNLTIKGKVTDDINQVVSDKEIQIAITNGNNITLQNIIVYTDDSGFFTFTINGKSIGNTEVLITCEDYEKLINIQTVESLSKLGKVMDKSTMPYVLITKPNGNIQTITSSQNITIPNGSTLTFISSYNGEVGYTTLNNTTDPWWCDDYSISNNTLTANECIYRIVSKETNKNYSDVLTINVEFSQEHTHNFGDWITDTSATCTTNGTKHRICLTCTDVEYDIIPAINHQFGNVSYTWNNNECTATRVCQHDSTHIETETVTGIYIKDTNATYSSNETGHYQAVFNNSFFTEQNTEKDSVEKAGTMLGYTYKEPTYTWDNNICTATKECNEDSTKNIIEIVTGIYVKDTDSTYTSNETGHYQAIFNNSFFTEQNTQKDSVEKEGTMLGYTYKDPTYIWDNNICTATKECNEDSTKNIIEVVTGIYIKDTNATYSSNETGHYQAIFNNSFFTEQNTEKDSVEKAGTMLGYTYKETIYTWDNNICTATKECNEDSTKNIIEIVTGIYVKDTQATCTKYETGHYKAIFINSIFTEQNTEKDSVTLDNSLLNHNYSSDWTIDKVASCSELGEKSHHCTYCNERIDITEIPKLDHNFGEWVTDKEPSSTEFGEKHRNCRNCQEVQTEKIEKLIRNVLKNNSIILISENGFDEGIDLSVNILNDEDIKDIIIKDKLILIGYDIHLTKDNKIVQSDDKLIVKLKLSDSLKSIEDLSVYNISENKNINIIETIRERDYLVFETSELSQYVITTNQTGSNPDVKISLPYWIIILIIVLVVLGIIGIILLVNKNKKRA